MRPVGEEMRYSNGQQSRRAQKRREVEKRFIHVDYAHSHHLLTRVADKIKKKKKKETDYSARVHAGERRRVS